VFAALVGVGLCFVTGPTAPPERGEPAAALVAREWPTWCRFPWPGLWFWYRSHAEEYDLPPASDDLLRRFEADVIWPLGRIPRRELFDVLLERFRPHFARWKDASEQERPALVRELLDRYYGVIAYSDYVLLFGNGRWRKWRESGQLVLRPPTGEGLPGGDPYAFPGNWGGNFGAWYRAYHFALGLPRLDEGFVFLLEHDIVGPFGRVPPPQLLRDLILIYRRSGVIDWYDSDDPTYERWGAAVRGLFRRLRVRLRRVDHRWMCRSKRWRDDCRDLGILPE
jgi:hypothetical protein